MNFLCSEHPILLILHSTISVTCLRCIRPFCWSYWLGARFTTECWSLYLVMAALDIGSKYSLAKHSAFKCSNHGSFKYVSVSFASINILLAIPRLIFVKFSYSLFQLFIDLSKFMSHYLWCLSISHLIVLFEHEVFVNSNPGAC
jgi:hypothetical protein